MSRISRLYNQNRVSFWLIILIIIFIILMIQLLNFFAKKDNESKKNNKNNIAQDEYVNESKSIISDGSVSQNVKTKYAKLIDNFLNNCINANFEDAYNMISEDCKNIYYDSLDKFENRYCKNKFNGHKKYSFQSWINGSKNIYQIKIFDDILATGDFTSNKYIEDFYTIVKENNEYKLNINNFISKDEINKEQENSNIVFNIKDVEIYKEYSIYTIKVKNNNANSIKIDIKEKSNTTYIEDNNKIKFLGLLYENLDNDLVINSNEEKEIRIKFNIIYRDDLNLKKMVFSDIVKENRNNNEKKEKVEILM